MSFSTSRTSRDMEAPFDKVQVTYVNTWRKGLVPWKLWEPDDSAREEYLSILSNLQSMKVWEHLSKHERFQPSAAFGFYMVGPKRSDARPCITIRTNSRSYGKKMRNAVLEQDWWAEFEASVPRVSVMYIHCCPKKLAGPSLSPSTSSMRRDIFTFEDVKTYCGAPIFLEIQDGDTTSQRAATLGGLLDVGGTVYGLMVAHAASQHCLHSEEYSGEPMLYIDDDIDNDVAGSEQSDSEQPPADSASPYEVMPTESLLSVLQSYLPFWASGAEFAFPPRGHNDMSRREVPKKLGSIHRISSQFNGDLYDWAIVQLDTASFAARRVNLLIAGWFGTQISTKLASKPTSSASILAATGSSGFVYGHLLSSPVLFQIEPETGPLEVNEAILEKELRLGDSGSWVFNEAGEPYGVIVAGVIGSRIAYVLPLAAVIQDMKERLATTVQLPRFGFWDYFVRGASESIMGIGKYTMCFDK